PRRTTPPARRRTPAGADSTTTRSSPVDVRLMGHDAAVRQLVAALQEAAQCGPASYRPMRDGAGARAYLSVIVPPDTPVPPTNG
ncbi:hypothetical protein, partial [Streptomyces sp. Amel2xC10]|uniref:hypothetical protein n=1 Tax=Streptomyces sp. Amel2xC10 TaxID=1305826 RepID=UPI000A08BA9E